MSGFKFALFMRILNLYSLVTQMVKNLPAMQETWVQSLGWKDLLEKRMTTHSSILAMDRGTWWTIQFMGLQRVGHD